MTINGQKLTAADILKLAIPKPRKRRKRRLREYCHPINLTQP